MSAICNVNEINKHNVSCNVNFFLFLTVFKRRKPIRFGNYLCKICNQHISVSDLSKTIRNLKYNVQISLNTATVYVPCLLSIVLCTLQNLDSIYHNKVSLLILSCKGLSMARKNMILTAPHRCLYACVLTNLASDNAIIKVDDTT